MGRAVKTKQKTSKKATEVAGKVADRSCFIVVVNDSTSRVGTTKSRKLVWPNNYAPCVPDGKTMHDAFVAFINGDTHPENEDPDHLLIHVSNFNNEKK